MPLLFHKLSFSMLRDFFWIVFLPVSFCWALLTYLRRRFYPARLKFTSRYKILCVGNIHSGGSGKTPLVVEICKKLKSQNPVIISRGYKGKLSAKGGRVEPGKTDGAGVFGDEPWMLAERLDVPVYVGRDRAKTVKEIEKNKTQGLIVMDDGFQHLGLNRNMDIVCIPTRHRLEDAFCLPLGELREPLSALKQASAVVLVNGDKTQSNIHWREFLAVSQIPVFDAQKKLDGLWEGDTPFEVVGGTTSMGVFCGIAHPEGFLEDVAAFGNTVFSEVFTDHHQYCPKDVQGLMKQAKNTGAELLVTTDKDWYKLRVLAGTFGIKMVSLRVRYDLPEDFWSFIEKQLGGN